MEKLLIKYSASGKALPPRPIKVEVPGWGGSAEMKKRDGSEPQPWHCPPFVEASAYGLELLYQYETECHVINDNGEIRFDWDYSKEPGGTLGDDEFGIFAPKPPKFYFFGTSLDIQAPPGHVVSTQPHPRFYTDDTGTVPCALSGHVQSEWFPKKLFVVFKVPPPGTKHIFRKGEPYVKLLFLPQRTEYEPQAMTAEEDRQRRDLEQTILFAKTEIARNVWTNAGGQEFNDHYKILAGAFAREGMAGVEEAVRQGVAAREALFLPPGKSMAECLDIGYARQCEKKYIEARDIYFAVLRREPNNAEAVSRLGILAATMELPTLALTYMKQAVAMQPQSAAYHNNLAEMLRRLGRLDEAEQAFIAAVRLNPNDPQALSNLGLTLAQRGRWSEGIDRCRSALAMAPHMPILHARLGSALQAAGDREAAIASYRRALDLNPNFAPARRALEELSPQKA